MTEHPDVARASALLQQFDVGPLPDLDLDALVREGHRRRRLLLVNRGLAVAAVVVLVTGVGVLVARSATPQDAAVSPGPSVVTPTGGGSASSAPALPSPAPSGGGPRPPDCVASELVPRVTGDGAGGTEYVVLWLQNTGTRVCWLGSFADLAGVDATGRATSLAFTRSSDPSQVEPPLYGPGPLAPGQDGAVSLSLMDHDCPRPTPTYQELRITVGAGQTLTMPFPPQLQVTGCYGIQGPMGPVPPPTTQLVSPPPTGTSALVPADSALPAAGVCGTSTGPVVTVILAPDVPEPRCVKVTGDQQLRVVNATGSTPGLPASTVIVTWAGNAPRTLAPGASTTYDRPFSAYLAPGVHDVHVSLYAGSGPEIWLS